MSKNKLYRILAFAVVLTALFALNAFAEITGGIDEKVGKLYCPAPAVTFDNNTLTWTAENVRLVRFSADPSVNGTRINLNGAKAYTFNPATEAGLWALYTPENDTYEESQKTLVYVRGEYLDRKQIGEQSSGYAYGEGNLKTSSNMTLAEGRLQRTSAFWASDSNLLEEGQKHLTGVYYNSISYIDANKSDLEDFHDAKVAYNNGIGTKEAVDKAFEKILYNGNGIGIKEIFYSYVLTQKEIIPISEVCSYKFALYRSLSNCFDYQDNEVKFVAYVADKNGNITEYVQYCSYDLSEKPTDIVIDFTDVTKWETELPDEGYLVRFEVYPYEGIKDYTRLDVGTVTGNSQLYYRFYCDDSAYVICEPPVVDVEGISLVLDGAIGAKINFSYDPAEVKAATLVLDKVTGMNPICATLENGKGEVIVPFYPRLVNTLSYTADLVCTKTDDTQSTVKIKNISVKSYIDAMQEDAENPVYEKYIDLINALEVYCDYAENYFSDDASLGDLTLETAEGALVSEKSNRSQTGGLTGVEFYSTSLVLLDTMKIRHYFVIDDTLALNSIVVSGASSLIEAAAEAGDKNRYAYVDVENISADKLTQEQTVVLTLGEQILTIKFSVMDYVQLTQTDTDKKLSNLAKAIAKYAYTASNIS